MKTTNKKSPLKAEPLRNPGQSLDEEINALWDDKALTYIIYIIGFLAIAIVDWYRWITKTPMNPIVSTIIAVVVIIFCVYKLIEGWNDKIRLHFEHNPITVDKKPVTVEKVEAAPPRLCMN